MDSAALDFLALGIGVIPIGHRDKRPEFRLLPRDEHNYPSWEIFKTQLPDTEFVKQFLESGYYNYGVVTGWRHLVVIDFDDSEEYRKWLWWAARTPSARHVADLAYRVATARGVHVYLRLPHVERSRKLGKVDIKAAGGYVLGPGSVHPSGAIYRPLRNVYVFPLVEALSDVIPSSLLMQDAQPILSKPVAAGPADLPPALEYDPWNAAMNPHLSFGEDLVTTLRKAFRVESFFPDAHRSSGDGRWLMARCPFHQDNHPSFWIDTTKQICGCFSGCTPKPLDSINLYARLYGLSNLEAINVLAKIC